jgi:UDP-N-acetylglucosamine acyltransferase
VILANGAALGGHVEAQDHAIVGGLAGCTSTSASASRHSARRAPWCRWTCRRSAPWRRPRAAARAQRDRPPPAGFGLAAIRRLKRAYRLLFHGGGRGATRSRGVRAALGGVPEVAALLDFVAGSRRGVCR